MTKRTLYAVAELPVSLFLAATVLLASPVVPGAAAQGAACAACVALSVSPDQVSLLPAELDGMEVLIRVAPGAEAGAADAMASIEKRGGRPGLLMTALPASTPATELMAAW